MSSQADYASQMVQALRVTEPDLDTSVGSVTRKIIDAVAEGLASASVDNHLLTYQYDVDSKVGADLDDFVGLFGMARIPARRASGIVTFTRSSSVSAANTYYVPVNTSLRSTGTPSVAVLTVTGAYLESGIENVNVVVQAVDAGPAGNVSADTLSVIASPLIGIGVVTNVAPLTGGTVAETDSQLRDRWKRTVFRNLSGTESMYLGIALDDPDCYNATVVGSSKRRREQVQITLSGEGITTVEDAAYVFSEPVFVGGDIDSGDLAIKDIDYTWDTTVNPPKVVVINAGVLPAGGIFEVDYEYQPLSSRNDPGNSITNRVDIWVGGQRATSAVQSCVFRTNLVFNGDPADSGSAFSLNRFVGLDDTHPTVGHFFIPLAYGPILTVPSTISIGGATFALASEDNPMGTTETVDGEDILYAYRIVHEDTAWGYSATSRFGLEWTNTSGYHPVNNSTFAIGGQSDTPYAYNSMISDIQDAVEKWRLLAVDAKVHQAKTLDLRLTIGIVYEARANTASVNTAIDTAVSDYMTGVGFQGRVQASDLLQVIHNVVGVDNVRFIDSRDYAAFDLDDPATYADGIGVERMINGEAVTTYVDDTGRVEDIHLGDNELPALYSVKKYRMVETSFERGYLNT